MVKELTIACCSLAILSIVGQRASGMPIEMLCHADIAAEDQHVAAHVGKHRVVPVLQM